MTSQKCPGGPDPSTPTSSLISPGILLDECMVRLRVGAGGWAYFQVPGEPSLKAYSSAFDFVEVNSTYYEYPSLRNVSRWRTSVPDGFEFAVRCHREIGKAPTSAQRGVGSVVERMEVICKTLRATVLTVLLPRAGFGYGDITVRLEELLSTFDAGGTRVAVEFRGSPPPDHVIRMLDTNDAIHCVDLSREQPRTNSDILYTRLFGKGKDNIYEFDDEELQSIAAQASAPRFEKSILAFHGVRMYRDAARLRAFLNSGEFPRLTEYVGLESLNAILKEDTQFPVSKTELVARHGWKLFDLTSSERHRAAEYLSRLPDRDYPSVESLISSLEAQFQGKPTLRGPLLPGS